VGWIYELAFSEMTPEEIQEVSDVACLLTRSEGLEKIEYARERNLLRARLAHWEVAELFRFLMPLAMYDAMHVENFDEFRTLWTPIVGEEATAWLPSLYLAVVASPSVASDQRGHLACSTLPFLEYED
jgi:hypothetical protein